MELFDNNVVSEIFMSPVGWADFSQIIFHQDCDHVNSVKWKVGGICICLLIYHLVCVQ